MKRCGIYRIDCIPASLVYIGSSKDIDGRWKQHRRRLGSNIHHNLGMQIAWNEHGDKAFMWTVIEEVEAGDLKTREQYWIEYHRKLKVGTATNIQGASSDMQAVNFEASKAAEMENPLRKPGVWPWEACDRCGGSGRASSPVGNVRCAACGGTGRRADRRRR